MLKRARGMKGSAGAETETGRRGRQKKKVKWSERWRCEAAHEENIQSMKTMTKREKDEDKNGNKSYKKNILPTLVVVGLLLLSLGWAVYVLSFTVLLWIWDEEKRGGNRMSSEIVKHIIQQPDRVQILLQYGCCMEKVKMKLTAESTYDNLSWIEWKKVFFFFCVQHQKFFSANELRRFHSHMLS